jgi:hypothetical protein
MHLETQKSLKKIIPQQAKKFLSTPKETLQLNLQLAHPLPLPRILFILWHPSEAWKIHVWYDPEWLTLVLRPEGVPFAGRFHCQLHCEICFSNPLRMVASS